MAIRVECPHCGAKFAVPESRAGQVGRCKCGGSITVPAAPAAPAADEPELVQMAETIATARAGTAAPTEFDPATQQLCRYCGMATRRDVASCEWCGRLVEERTTAFDAGAGYQDVSQRAPIITYVVRVLAILTAVGMVFGAIGMVLLMVVIGRATGGAGAGLLGPVVALPALVVFLAIAAFYWWLNRAVADAQPAAWWVQTVLCVLGLLGGASALLSGGLGSAMPAGMAAGPAMAAMQEKIEQAQSMAMLSSGLNLVVLICWVQRGCREWFGISSSRG